MTNMACPPASPLRTPMINFESLPEHTASKLKRLIELRDECFEAVSLAADSVKVREDKLRDAHQELVRRQRGDPVVTVFGGSRSEVHSPRDEAAEQRLEETIKRE